MMQAGGKLFVLVILAVGMSCIDARASEAAADDRQKSVEFLERLQRNAYAALGTKPRHPTPADMEKFLKIFLESPTAEGMTDAQKEQLRKRITEIFSPNRSYSQYEDPLGLFIVQQLDQRIRTVIAASSLKLQGTPVFGTLPTRRANARTFAVPGTTNVVIVFEDQLANFALLFTKAVAYAFPIERGKDGEPVFSRSRAAIVKQLETNPLAVQRFVEVLEAYLFNGAPRSAPPYLQAQPFADMAALLRESLELFVLGHEYGHYTADHLKGGQLVAAAIGDEKVIEIVRSWKAELEADSIGVQLSVEAMRRSSAAYTYAGADFFFTTLDILDRGLRVLTTGVEKADPAQIMTRSHPPATLRRDHLRQAAKVFYPDEAAEMLASAEILQFASELLWEKAKPRLTAAYKTGRGPHPSWLGAAPQKPVEPPARP